MLLIVMGYFLKKYRNEKNKKPGGNPGGKGGK
jgi:hypothetical protein